jgi:SAM-dependent methyltransferase
VLSLGCGTGDWEFAVAREAPGRIEFELVDLNEHLMASARRLAAAEGLPLTTRVGDVNRIEIEPCAWDYVLCRSSLHHFLELERLFGEIRKGLRPGGAFVVIGEWVGRNGLQLYPETERAAQAIFERLPERLRRDNYSGRIDSRVPNVDHSVNSFEAVRSEDIMPLLLRCFEPVGYVLYDAYVSLLLDFRYGPNYNLENPADRALVEEIVRGDREAIESGALRPTAMFGIYRC